MDRPEKDKRSFTKNKNKGKGQGAGGPSKGRAPSREVPILADSFEAEEKKNSVKPDQQAKKVQPQKRRRSRPSPRRDEYETGRDEGIKTKSGGKYIPFDDGGDEDYIEDSPFEGSPVPARRNNGRRDRRDEGAPGAVAGRNAVRELLRSGRSVDKIYVKSGSREGSIVVIVAEAVNRKIPIVETSSEKLNSLAGGTHHQGVVALAAEKQYTDVDEILRIAKERGETPLVVIADGIEDPQNLGSLIRCAECAGAHGIIIPKRRAVGLTPIVAKASAGAIEHMAIAKVTNIADTLERLKKEGFWVYAAEAGGTPYYKMDYDVPCAIVLGSEGFGVSRLIKERADAVISIPMYGHVNSLNVSTAASVILCHASRIQHGDK